MAKRNTNQVAEESEEFHAASDETAAETKAPSVEVPEVKETPEAKEAPSEDLAPEDAPSAEEHHLPLEMLHEAKAEAAEIKVPLSCDPLDLEPTEEEMLAPIPAEVLEVDTSKAVSDFERAVAFQNWVANNPHVSGNDLEAAQKLHGV